MAARTGHAGGRQNYYSVSYGKLSTKVKEAPEGFTEIAEAELKSKTMACENIDLRNKFVRKEKGDYPIVRFYDAISGSIQGIEKDEYAQGISLKVSIIDEDDDNSVIQSKFYSKYTENLLNRLLALTTIGELTFSPYSMPDTYTPEGQKEIKYYNSGISVKMGGEKIKPFYTGETVKDMPETERMKNAEGKMVTSRVARVDFLFEKVQKLVIPKLVANTVATQPAIATPTSESTSEEVQDDLPF